MDIYSILSSKPHNTHHLNRYIAFILRCQQANKNTSVNIHKHHICPKADDMFPEYKSFSKHTWNMAKLTPRQHFIAHVMLWKIYPTIASQMHALWQMRHKNNETLNSRLYQSLRLEYQKNVSDRFKNKVSIYDEEGNFSRIQKDEFWQNKDVYTAISANRIVARNSIGKYEIVDINEFNMRSDLVGTTKGMKMWNDGNKNIVAFDKPNQNFVEGIIPLTEEEKYVRNIKRKITISERYTKEEIYIKNSLAQKKYWSNIPPEQRKKTQQARLRMSEAAKIKNPGFTATCKCPVCGKEGQKANISRHHGLNGEKCRW